MNRSKRDLEFMSHALYEAEIAYHIGQLPIAAVLVINGKEIDIRRNSSFNHGNLFDHAENLLIQKNSIKIKEASEARKSIELFTTLEPCLQCFGAAVHNRFTRIVYACPDPAAGSTHISPPTEWYRIRWPEIVRGPLARESYDIFMKFIEQDPEAWKDIIRLYRELEPRI